MYLFKTSGKTFDSVIKNQKHAFKNLPRDWFIGETILISKNKKDCNKDEKQISYIMKLSQIRKITQNELTDLWPGNIGRWEYIAICENTEKLENPFNLDEILDKISYSKYRPIMTFRKLDFEDEKIINEKFNIF